jgi:hypothetical protein
VHFFQWIYGWRPVRHASVATDVRLNEPSRQRDSTI